LLHYEQRTPIQTTQSNYTPKVVIVDSARSKTGQDSLVEQRFSLKLTSNPWTIFSYILLNFSLPMLPWVLSSGWFTRC